MHGDWLGREQMKVRVFIACSLDGFIAGPNDELDWLEGPDGTEDTFTPFFKQIGAMLMGRGFTMLQVVSKGTGLMVIPLSSWQPTGHSRQISPRFKDLKGPLENLSQKPKQWPKAGTFIPTEAI